MTAAGRLPRPGSALAAAAPVEPRTILFIRIDRIGDMVLSTPALREIKRAFPGSHLTVLASRANAPVLDHNPYVDRVCIYPAGSRPFSKWQLSRRLRLEAFDLVIDGLDSHDLEPALFARLVRPRLAIGFEGFGREVCFDRAVSGIQCRQGFIEASFDLLNRIGLEDGNRSPELFLTPSEVCRAEQWLAAHTGGVRLRVGIHPGAHYETQKWGTSHYADLIRQGRVSDTVEWILIGGPADFETVEQIRSAAGGAIPAFVDGDLRRSMALISRLEALVCNNSGPLHIATALQIPTVSFMGPTNATRWWPVGSPARVLRAEQLDCLGCEKGTCPEKNTECMRRISPKMAWDALQEVLSEAGAACSPGQSVAQAKTAG
ncbi:MAG: glycosyltransferase family 9 protein [Desulfobacterales bacterium]